MYELSRRLRLTWVLIAVAALSLWACGGSTSYVPSACDDIGDIHPAGSRVYQDGNRVSGSTDLCQGQTQETGHDSAAEYDFDDGSVARMGRNSEPRFYYDSRGLPGCRIRAESFMRGDLYIETGRCRNVVATPYVRVEGVTHYHVTTSDRSTVVTVIRGAVRAVAPSGATAIIRPSQEAEFGRDGSIRGPYTVSPDQMRERLDWLQRFKFPMPPLGAGTTVPGAATVPRGMNREAQPQQPAYGDAAGIVVVGRGSPLASTRDLEDPRKVRGLRLCMSGGDSQTIGAQAKRYGINVVVVPYQELFEAMQRGVCQAVLYLDRGVSPVSKLGPQYAEQGYRVIGFQSLYGWTPIL